MLNCCLRNVVRLSDCGRKISLSAAINSAVSKSDLSKLRKISGFSFSKCKEALMKSDSDIDKAHSWLKAEADKHGWSQMGKLADRAMSDGLIGIQVATRDESETVAMVELNCETDFVARNQNFHRFLHVYTSAVISHFDELREINSISLNSEELKRLLYTDNESNKQETLDHLLAVNVGSLGENMQLTRAIALRVGSGSHIAIYTHLSWPEINKKWKETLFGKYGVILKYRFKDSLETAEMSEQWKKNSTNIARQICQHIVGMNPTRIGNEETDKPKKEIENEENLIYQQFLFDENVRIKDLLDEHRLKIDDFVRFNCGENAALAV